MKFRRQLMIFLFGQSYTRHESCRHNALLLVGANINMTYLVTFLYLVLVDRHKLSNR